ncbi:GNAT family N-acetyltransferase [Parabacteroides bouchesdurhonensis]|uniref:GNAT family N-acetyltransferase n=1 Tax=Parabacteroides bouchesdurhonensis TaxID=1936995 RepID=UPI000C8565A7|nr:GNAT family N-acetyltransferase [Parabacteroides bouchesdurhonensis]
MNNKDKYRLLCNTEESIPIFSRDWWLDTVCGEANWDVLLIEQKGRMQAALPFYIPYRGIISMPPYTQTMGPWFAPVSGNTKYTTELGRRQSLCKIFTKALQAYPHFLQNFNYEVTDWLPFYWAGYKQTTRYTYILKDISNTALLWENMSSNARGNIRKAQEKRKITVRKGISTEDFLKVYALTFKRQKISLPPQVETLKALISICRERGQGDLWGGYDEEGRLHAAVFVVWQKSSAWCIAAGGDPTLRNSGAHTLVLWEVIQYLKDICCQFDFEGSMIPGVEQFFREFGAIQTPFFTITKGKLSLLYRAWLKARRMIMKQI